MISIKRAAENPILEPNKNNRWEAEAVFNPSVSEKDGVIHLVYRAVSARETRFGINLEISSIGHATSRDGVRFKNRHQLIVPEYEWEKFGCEDPRITKFKDKYFIFYTALSRYPFSAEGIKIGVALTKDFKKIKKHPVTPFNSKAMALFPEPVNGKIAALLTVHTDMPPAKICLAFFEKEEDIWAEAYWKNWYANLESHVLPIPKGDRDHIELGSPPIKTKKGWLFFYSYIYNYFSPPPIFGIQALLLDFRDLQKIIGEVKRPFLIPEEEYELYDRVPNVVFPSGALLKKRQILLYYSAADTTCCLAKLTPKQLIDQLISVEKRQLKRFEGNPIIQPIKEHSWESKATFNPGAIFEGGKVHLIYRAMSEENTSVFGYASAVDGVHISERLPEPIYFPREPFEMKLKAGENSGCEDPRLTKIGDNIYMCYTAFDGQHPPRVAFTSIKVRDFLDKKWNWAKPVLISPPDKDDKDATVFPEKIKGKYVFLHRLGTEIWIDFVDSLEFDGKKFLGGEILMSPRETPWDSRKIGIAGPPIKTRNGWLLLYHGISKRADHYNIRAVLLELDNPAKIIYRPRDTIIETRMSYEKEGIVSNVIFPCGAVLIKNKLFVYYGAADKVVAVAAVELKDLMQAFLREGK
jgi:predicted GH43/DUF377 family glycosyl hydrolase